jgi:cell division protease FtsH
VLVGDNEQEVFLGRELQRHREVSEKTAQLVDSEVARVIGEAHARAKAVLTEHVDLLHLVAKQLLERETLTRDDIERLRRGETLPPRTEFVPPASLTAAPTPVAEPRRNPPLLGGPEPAPA